MSRAVTRGSWLDMRHHQLLNERGLSGWLSHQRGYFRFYWKGSRFPEVLRLLRYGIDDVAEPSEFSLAHRFLELRLAVDVTGDHHKGELREFARLSGCEDLIEEAEWSAEQFAAYVEQRGGSYPIEGLRKSFSKS